MPRPFNTPVLLPGDPTQALHAATKQYVDGRAGTVVNYYQPLTTNSFTATAGVSNTYNFSASSYGVQLVFVNGQQLQTSEYSSSSSQITVTPVEGAFVGGEAVVVLFANSNVFSGAISSDIEVTDATKGVILKDRVNGNRYRLFMSGGVLGTELA